MSRGKRFDDTPKLNIKKVIAVIVAIIVIIMFIFIIKGILDKDSTQNMITSKEYLTIFQDNKWGVIDSTRKRNNTPIIRRNDNNTKQ